MKKRNKKKGFTLVELLAVIVILAIILVIAVPKVMSIIEDAKMGTLESTAKMIASGAEKQKVQNTVLGNTEEITCESVAKLNNLDYKSCTIEFDNNTAKVTIQGNGKFDNLWVCEGTKTNAVAQNSSCKLEIQSIEVEHPEFLAGETLSLDKFHVIATYSDGSTRTLENGTKIVGDESVEGTIITTPNWPEVTDSSNEEDNTWEVTYEGATSLEIKFDDNIVWGKDIEILMYDKEGNQIYRSYSIDGETRIVNSDYVKIAIDNRYNMGVAFKATIRPSKQIDAEYTVSPSVVPTGEGTFDLTVTTKEKSISKKITLNRGNHNFGEYIESLVPFDDIFANSLMKTSITYNNNTYDAGIRYFGSASTPKNNIYYNCEDIDTNGVAYGLDGYDYKTSCEVWRIIGVFNVDDGNGNTEKRVKIINKLNNIFGMSWDSSSESINNGKGINQWGESGSYKGSDIMNFLNGYYIRKEGATCTYCDDANQEICSNICDIEPYNLKFSGIKPITSNALNMIKNAIWDTYAVSDGEYGLSSGNADTTYLQEKGISSQNTGKICTQSDTCNDNVERTTNWTGLVGLMSVSDALYADYGKYDGWLYYRGGAWTMTPVADSQNANLVFYASESDVYYANDYGNYKKRYVYPSVYLKPEVKVISGDGTSSNPYKLAL